MIYDTFVNAQQIKTKFQWNINSLYYLTSHNSCSMLTGLYFYVLYWYFLQFWQFCSNTKKLQRVTLRYCLSILKHDKEMFCHNEAILFQSSFISFIKAEITEVYFFIFITCIHCQLCECRSCHFAPSYWPCTEIKGKPWLQTKVNIGNGLDS